METSSSSSNAFDSLSAFFSAQTSEDFKNSLENSDIKKDVSIQIIQNLNFQSIDSNFIINSNIFESDNLIIFEQDVLFEVDETTDPKTLEIAYAEDRVGFVKKDNDKHIFTFNPEIQAKLSEAKTVKYLSKNGQIDITNFECKTLTENERKFLSSLVKTCVVYLKTLHSNESRERSLEKSSNKVDQTTTYQTSVVKYERKSENSPQEMAIIRELLLENLKKSIVKSQIIFQEELDKIAIEKNRKEDHEKKNLENNVHLKITIIEQKSLKQEILSKHNNDIKIISREISKTFKLNISNINGKIAKNHGKKISVIHPDLPLAA